MTATEVRERPILFKPDMVRAILDGRKTMTRRVVNIPPIMSEAKCDWLYCNVEPKHQRYGFWHQDKEWRCPFGGPGDTLWVRETWQNVYECFGQRFTYQPQADCKRFVEYAATVKDGEHPPRWRSPIHMPRWAARLILEVTAVKVERLSDITEEDATAEGIRSWTKDGHLYKHGHIEPGDKGATPWTDMHRNSRDAFRDLWESINGKGSWRMNPWVWCISFKVAKGR